MAKTNIAAAFASMQWIILQSKLEEIKIVAERFEAGIKLTGTEAQEYIHNSVHVVDMARHGGGGAAIQENVSTAYVSIIGTIMNRASNANQMSPAASYNSVAAQINEAAANPKVSRIILDLDTPGGTVVGVDILASAIREAKKIKPVIAVVNDMAASAGYWLASQCSEIACTATSLIGSISVLATHTDVSALEAKMGIKTKILATGPFKALGNPHEPLSDVHEKKILARMQTTHDLFVRTISDGRGLDVAEVNKLATGDTWNGEEAIENGLADYQATLEEVVTNPRKPKGSTVTVLAPVSTATVMTPEEQAALNARIDSLTTTVEKLTGGLTSLVTAQTAMVDNAAKERAQSLVNPLIKSGALDPAQGATLIEQATANYDLVSSTIEALAPKASGRVPLANVIELDGGRKQFVGGETAEVYKQLGIMDEAGNLTLENVTLPLDHNGSVTYNLLAAPHKADRVVAQVNTLLGAWS